MGLIGGRHDQNLAGRLKACSIVLDIIILPCPRKSLSMLVIFRICLQSALRFFTGKNFFGRIEFKCPGLPVVL